MKNFWVICKKELTSYFYSPVAYVVITIFVIISGFFFYNLVVSYSELTRMMMSQQYNQYMGQIQLSFMESIFRPLFSNLSVIMLLMLPLLTMRLLAEEKKNGTFELLLTYPIRDTETVLGKFFACLLVFAVMIGLTLVYPLFLSTLDTMGAPGGIDVGPLFASYLGLLLMGGAFIAFGVLASSLTSNQIVAAVITFGALLMFWLVGWSAYSAGPGLAAVLKDLSLIDHFDNFAKGTINSHDVIYYLNMIIFCLFLTLRSLESNKWRG
jgi:ABC-2 type transport system permease protein